MTSEDKKFDLKLNLYYILVGVISFVALFILPFFSSEIGVGWKWPTTAAGWVVYVVQQALMATVNFLIFHSFVCQSHINVRDNENYKKAREIFHKFTNKEVIPLTLEQFNRHQYGRKGLTIFIGTLIGGFALTQAILSYDYIRMLTYLTTIIMGIIFGIYVMKTYEDYLTYGYLQAAEYYQHKKEQEAQDEAEARKALEMAQAESVQQEDDSSDNTR